MKYVKKGAMIFLVDDSEVPKYTHNGFEVFTPPAAKQPKVPEGNKNQKDKTPKPSKQPNTPKGEGEADGKDGK